MQLFQLKKTLKEGQCQAMRCSEPHLEEGVAGQLWGLSGTVKLCVKHKAMSEDYAQKNPDGIEVVTSEGNQIEGAQYAGFSNLKAVASWLGKLYEFVQSLAEEERDGKEALEVVKSLTTNTQEELQQVSGFSQDVQLKLKELAGKEKEITVPISTALARIRELIQPAKQVWVDVGAILRAHLEAAALKEEQRNKAAQAEANKLAAAGEDPTAALAQTTNTSDLAGVSLKIKWVAKVVNVSLMPEAFIVRVPNQKKLKEHCEAAEGEPEPIPGVEFERDVASRIQASKVSQ